MMDKLTTTYEWVECWRCGGHGVYDRGYHNPDECGTCNGSGRVIRYASGVYAKYPSGPFLGRDAKPDAALSGARQ